MKNKSFLLFVIGIFGVASVSTALWFGFYHGRPHSSIQTTSIQSSLQKKNASSNSSVSSKAQVTPAVSTQTIPASTAGSISSGSSLSTQQTVSSSSAPHSNHFFPGASVVARQSGTVNSEGYFERVKVLETDFKYPFVRVVEMVQEVNGKEQVFRQEAMVADQVLVKLTPESSRKDLELLSQRYGATVFQNLGSNAYLIKIPGHQPDSMSLAIAFYANAKETILYAEPNYMAQASGMPNDPDFPNLWGLKNTGQIIQGIKGAPGADIHAPEAWSITTGDDKIIVAVLDTGVDYTHPDLAANVINKESSILEDGKPAYPNDIHGWNFYGTVEKPDGDNETMDKFGHGTHVAGTIGAVGNNGKGITGVCWKATILPVKISSDDGEFAALSDHIRAVRYAIARGARVMNNSYGGYSPSEIFRDVISEASNAGILFVAAAGNDGVNTDIIPHYPACYNVPNIISVAATDSNDQLAVFPSGKSSNYGKKSVHIAAPGKYIYSTLPAGVYGYAYGYASGTSMATPHVVGAIALLLSKYPNLTVTEVKERILKRGDFLASLINKTSSSTRLNVYNALDSNWKPTPVIGLTGVKIDDPPPGGNGDQVPNPGETLVISPTVINLGQIDAQNVSIKLDLASPDTTVLTQAAINLGLLASGKELKSPSPFQIKLGANLADNQVVTLTWKIDYKDQQVTTTQTSSFVVHRIFPNQTEIKIPFIPGEMKADPARNLVYITNRTSGKIYAIDTKTGQRVASSSLVGSYVGAPPEIGQMAISLDGKNLFVALTQLKNIQVFSLPDLKSIKTFDCNFSPVSLAYGVTDILFVSTKEGDGKDGIEVMNALSGVPLDQLKHGLQSSYQHEKLLRSTSDGKELYLGAYATNTVNNFIVKFSYNKSLPFIYGKIYSSAPSSGMNDFVLVDSGSESSMYIVSEGMGGIRISDRIGTSSGVIPFGFGLHGMALQCLPDTSSIYLGANIGFESGIIRKMDRFFSYDPKLLHEYPIQGGLLPVRGMAVTPNGSITYLKTKDSDYWVGLISDNKLQNNFWNGLNLKAVAFSDTQIDLSWTDFESDGVYIERQEGSGGVYQKIATLGKGVTAFSDKNLKAGTLYYYRLTTKGGSSLFQELQAGVTKGIPAAPSGLQVVEDVQNKAIRLKWNDNSFGHYIDSLGGNFNIERKGEGEEYQSIGTSKNLLWEDKYFAVGTKYFYRVYAATQTDTSDYSNEVTVDTKMTTPSGLEASTITEDQIDLTWVSDDFGPTGSIEIWRSTDGINFSKIKTVGQVEGAYSDHGLKKRTRYYYHVRAVNKSGVSPYSNDAMAITMVMNTEDVLWGRIAAGFYHTVFLTEDGTVWTFGNNSLGQLGDPSLQESLVPNQVPGLDHIIQVAAADHCTFALREDPKGDQTLWAWGDNWDGQLGIGKIYGKEDKPVQLVDFPPKGVKIAQISAGSRHVVARLTDGTVWAWGWNYFGQIGNGTTDSQSKPVQVKGLLKNAKWIAAGYNHTVALLIDNTIWTWGSNGDGKLGIGIVGGADKTVPTKVESLFDVNITRVMAGTSSTFALGADGDVWGWGGNSYGELGDPNLGSKIIKPLKLNISGVINVACGLYYTLFLKQDGGVWGCGDNFYGELGEQAKALVPTRINLFDAIGFSTNSHSVFVRYDGTIWAGGNNSYGQLGDGTKINRSKPVQIIGFKLFEPE